ncbi:MAG: M48 family metallopeptidase [Pseudomonadota bacterium]
MARFAGSYSDGRTAAQLPVQVELMVSDLACRDADGRAVAHWPYETLAYVEAPYPGRPLRLRNGQEDPARLTVSDPDILAELAPRAPQLAPGKHRQAGLGKALLLGLAGIAMVLVILLYALPWGASQAARVIPISWERALGERALDQVDEILAMVGGGRPARCDGAEGRAALDALVARLAEGDGSGYDYEVLVLDHGIVNAFALPGGQMVIFRGLLDQARSPEVVAGILAHEMGHVTARHGTQALLRNISLAVLFDVLFEDPTGGSLSGLGLALSNLSYGRDAEREADQLALERLMAVDIKASGLAEFFAKLKEDHGETEPAFQLLSTHPSHGARQAFFEAAQGRGGPAMTDADWRALKKICNY